MGPWKTRIQRFMVPALALCSSVLLGSAAVGPAVAGVTPSSTQKESHGSQEM